MKSHRMLVTLFAVCVLTGAFVCSVQSQTCQARLLENREMLSLLGGACEEGCETDADHCGGWSQECKGSVTHGSSCLRCRSDAQLETCHDWGFCIGSSCSECHWDTTNDCGQQDYGTCVAGSSGDGCQIGIYGYSVCGTVSQCHTYGGW